MAGTLSVDTIENMSIDERRLGALVRVAVATGVTVLMIVSAGRLGAGNRDLDLLGYGLLIISGAALAAYRRWPVAALLTVTVAHFAYQARTYQEGEKLAYFAIIAALLLVTHEGRWQWTVGAAGISSVALVTSATRPGLESDPLPALIAMATAILLGLWLRTRSQLIAEARERAEQAERTKEEEARRRVDEERLRIAREVHDTGAHSIATINVQAGVAVHVLDKRPEQARDALVAIKQASADAMRDLRSTLGMMRGVGRVSRSPSPRLAQLDDLVAMARDAGLQAEVDVHGEGRDLPSSVDLAAYRILQESLTNVIKHARARRVTLSLSFGARRIALRVDDDGRGPTAPSNDGNGIRGMRERAELLGGSLTAAARAEGGFSVQAALPYEDEG
jgi:signal transduction histidine kinase